MRVAAPTLVVALLTLSLTSQAWADDALDVDLTFTISSRLSPYEDVCYELKMRGSTLIATLTKDLAGDYGSISGLGLIPSHSIDRILEELESCGVFGLEPEVPAPYAGPMPIYDLNLRLDGTSVRLIRFAGAVEHDSPFWCAATVLMSSYDQYGDPVLFRNLFFDDGEFGSLNTDSVPSARLHIDGFDTGLTTPVIGLPLLPGIHILRYVNTGMGIDRTYDARIVEEMTTLINVQLR